MQVHIGYVCIYTVWVVHWLMNVVVNIGYIRNVKLHAMDPLHVSSHWVCMYIHCMGGTLVNECSG